MSKGKELKVKIEEYRQEVLEFQLEKVMLALESAVSKGYKGCYYGYWISPELGAMLEKEDIKYKTFTDGEFEESKIWIE